MRLVKIVITEDDYFLFKDQFTTSELKEVIIKDDFFDNDERHKALKKESRKAYTSLKEYEFNKRYNIKP